MGVSAGFGVGTGAIDGAAGGLSGGVAGSFTSFFFLPVVAFFCEVRRGVGALRGCAIELPSLLKKSPIGLPATAESPPVSKASTSKTKATLFGSKSIGAVILHYVAPCSISLAPFLGETPRYGVQDNTARRAYPSSSLGRVIFPCSCSLFQTLSRANRFMNFIVCLVIGAVLGALGGAGIFFAPEEPYKWQILLAATLKGALVGLLTGFSLAPDSRWWAGIATGAVYGCAFGLVIYLAKGGPKSGDAPYVIPSSIITGALTGLFIILWAFKA